MGVMDKVQQVVWDQRGVKIVRMGRAGLRMADSWDVFVDGRFCASVGSWDQAQQIADHQARPSMRARRARRAQMK